MQRRQLDLVRPGDVLARTIFDEAGRPLLTAGTTLSEHYLGCLQRRGYFAVDIQDGLADDVAPRDVISHRVRSVMATHVSEIFGQVANVAAERARGQTTLDGAIDVLGEQALPILDAEDLIGQLYNDVESLIDEILESAAVEGLDSLKTHNRYTFEHSVDVAVIGTLLGARMRLPRRRLRELALGCLLHDVGKTYIDTAILDKPGPLAPGEYEMIRQHPRMGFELIRRMPMDSLLPAHVAYQHHERQNGSGYPRGLVGTNTIGPRLSKERPGAGMMLLIAEIGAVADVHSALSADRPYREAMPPDQVVAQLSKMAGTHLNESLVKLIRQLLPPFPLGRWVEATEGPRMFHRGVVVEVHPLALDRPTVRWILDERGEMFDSPFETDLRELPDTNLRCSDPMALLV